MNRHTMYVKRHRKKRRFSLSSLGRWLKRQYASHIIDLVPAYALLGMPYPILTEAQWESLPKVDWSDSYPCPWREPDLEDWEHSSHVDCPNCLGVERLPIPGRGRRAQKVWVAEKRAQEARRRAAYDELAQHAPKSSGPPGIDWTENDSGNGNAFDEPIVVRGVVGEH